MNDAYKTAHRLLPLAQSLVTRAGARHSRGDNELLQQIHDMVCELGASCPDNKKGAEAKLNDHQRR